MSRVEPVPKRRRPHRAQVIFALRVVVAALAALAISQYFGLPMPLWAVLTAIIVSQISVGRSLKATVDYLTGTLGGALYGGAIAVLVPHAGEWALLGVVAVAVAPLALIAAMKPGMTVAPLTAVIVILVPTITHVSPLASAIDRVIEVALGGGAGFVVSFLVLPSNAHRLVIESAARTLDQVARAFAELLNGLGVGLDHEALHRIQDHIGQAMVQLGATGEEAERERAARLTTGPDTRPLVRTLLRLRHDMVMIGRVAGAPLPAPLLARLRPALNRIQAAAGEYLRACGAALLARSEPPSLGVVDAEVAGYAAEIATIQGEGLTRDLAGDAAERFFALGFALQQIRQNCADLGERVAEWAETPKPARSIVTDGLAD